MLLPWLILIPFLSGVLCCQIERFNTKIIRYIPLSSMGLILIFSIHFWLNFYNYHLINYNVLLPQWWMEFIIPWIPSFGINIHLAIDGLSLLMLMITSLIGICAIICAWYENIIKYQGYFYANLMFIFSGIIGIFLAVDLFLFFFFWEIIIIPIYFLISLWGYNFYSIKKRIMVATKFFIYSQISGMLMLISIISLVIINYHNNGIYTFYYRDLIKTSMSYKVEYLIMIIFFISFAIKMPIVPLHGWIPDVHSCSPKFGSLDLSSFVIKISAYGMIRFLKPLFPNVFSDFSHFAVLLGIVNIFYGAWLSFSQYELKRLIAYSSVSHTGFLLIAIYIKNQLTYYGAIIQIITNSLSMAGLFILCGQLYNRFNTTDMRKLSGLWNKISMIPAFLVFFALTMLGMPGTGNFIGEFMILLGTYKINPTIAICATFGILFSSIYSLNMIHRICFGEFKGNIIASINNNKVSLCELTVIVPIIIIILLIGFYPQFILNTICPLIRDI